MVSAAPAAVVQNNYRTTDGSVPGGSFVTTNNLLATNLTSALFTGTHSGDSLVISRLYDGQLGAADVSTLATSVLPNNAIIQFDLNGAFDLTEIRTYASWDPGRDGQRYVVKYATGAAPFTFNTLYSLTEFNPSSSAVSSTLVRLTSDSGALVAGVVALQFEFDGFENGGTSFREFQVLGTSASSVPEPGTFFPAALLVAGVFLRRRRPRSHRRSGATASAIE